MKKGLMALLAAIAVVACAGTSYALAPVIDPLPEVNIGDQDPPEGTQHTDANWFVYTNAFKFDDYVNDPDTPDKSQLLWSFDEGDEPGAGGIATGNWFTVNGKTAVHLGVTAQAADDPVATDHLAPGAKELRSAATDNFAYFRDIILSPESGTVPFPDVASDVYAAHAVGKTVKFFVSDGSNVASASTIVRSIDGTMDSLSGTSPFTQYKDDKFDTQVSGDWAVFGPTNGSAYCANDYANGAYRIRSMTVPVATKYRSVGWNNNRPGWVPYDSIGSTNYVRAKFYVYAQNDPTQAWPTDGTYRNFIPSFGMRVTYRFAFHTQQIIQPHQETMANELAPSTDPANPSIYTLDFDPVDVPYLSTFTNTSGQKEGIGAAFETFDIDQAPRGYLALTELLIGTYPTSTLSGTPLRTKVYDGTRNAQAGDLHLTTVAPGDQKIAVYNTTGIAIDDKAPTDATATQPTGTDSAAGFTMDSTMVSSSRVADIGRDFFAGNADTGTSDFAARLRVKPSEIYKVRFHVTGNVATNLQPGLWLKAQSIGFAYVTWFSTQGGSYGAGGGDALRQMLPGIGCLNPDKNGTENGGWYTLIQNSPMDPAIQASQPLISAAPDQGVDAASRRDLKVGARLWDTITSPANANTVNEAGRFTVDRIEISVYPQFQ